MFDWTRLEQPLRVKVELSEGLTELREHGKLVQGDQNANAIVAEIYQTSGVPYDLTGCTVTLNFVRPDGLAVPPIAAEIGGEHNNIAVATLTDTCYRYSGMYVASLKIKKGDPERTVVRIIGDVISTENNGIVDDEQLFPTMEEMLAVLKEIENKTASAVAEVEAKGAETLASIPADYTALAGEVSQLSEEFNDFSDKFYKTCAFSMFYFERGSISGSTGEDTNSGTARWKTGFIPVKKGDRFIYQSQASVSDADYAYPIVYIYNDDKSYNAYHALLNVGDQYECESDGYVRLLLRTYDNTDFDAHDYLEHFTARMFISIPPDEEIDRNTAPAIISTATGEVVTISDSANRPLAGLRLYGKTTQDGTPTPDAPVDLVSVGDGGSIGAVVRGKNLLVPFRLITTIKGVTFTGNADGSISVAGTASGEINDALLGGWESAVPLFRLASKTPYILSGYTDQIDIRLIANTTTLFAKDYPFKTFDDAKTITALYVAIASGVTVNTVIYPQLENGYTPTKYEPYKDGGSVTVSTPNGLPGIPVTSGGNYTDADGQQWVCDEIDLERGVHVQRVYGQTITGDKVVYIDTNYKDTYGVVINIRTEYEPLVEKTERLVVSDKILGISWNNRNSQTELYAIWTMTNMQHSLRFPAGMDINNKSEAAEWVDANPFYVLYALAEPIETPLSAETLAAYRAMHTLKPHSTVYNDSGVGQQVDYVADTKLYIDKKLAAISAALLEM